MALPDSFISLINSTLRPSFPLKAADAKALSYFKITQFRCYNLVWISFYPGEFVKSLHDFYPSILDSTLRKVALDLRALHPWKVNLITKLLAKKALYSHFKRPVPSNSIAQREQQIPIKYELRDLQLSSHVGTQAVWSR